MITIDVKTLLISLLIIAVIVLVVFLIVVAANLIKSLKSLTKVLADVETVTDIASERSKQLDVVVGDVTKTISGVTSNVKDSEGFIKSVSIIIKAIVAIKNVLAKSEKKPEAQAKEVQKNKPAKK